MDSTEVFRALADPTRQAVFRQLVCGEKNASQLREGFSISQPAMSQHIAILRKAGLVRERRSGRHVNYSIDPEGLRPLIDWVSHYKQFWPANVGRLAKLLKEMDQ